MDLTSSSVDNMARYFFECDGCPDDEGTDLQGLESAKREAVVLMADLLRHRPELLWGTRSWNLTVTDEHRSTVLTIDLSGVIPSATSHSA
jgi:hypothetical protein